MRRPFVSFKSVSRRRARASVNSNVLVPSDVAKLYGIDRLAAQGLRGQGERVGFIEFARPSAQDDEAFWAVQSLDPALNTPVRTVTVGKDASDSTALPETDLDVQYAGALAPAAELTAYLVSDQTSLPGFLGSIYDALYQAASDGVHVLSISLGTTEGFLGQAGPITSALTGRSWRDFARFSRGLDDLIQSNDLVVCAAAGDSGAYGGLSLLQLGPQAIWPAIQPAVLAVGGTQLATPGAVASAEQAWGGQTFLTLLPGFSGANTMAVGSGGGGVSRLLAPPAYQAALHYTGRAIPDIAAFAGPLAIIDQGSALAVWGTSAAAPIAAAAIALLHQSTGEWLTHADVYARARDITAGNNWNDLLVLLLRLGYSQAHVGYDLCTGAGALDLRAWAGPGSAGPATQP
jgi:subtilase family serine protease